MKIISGKSLLALTLSILPIVSVTAQNSVDPAAVAEPGHPLLWLAAMTLGAGVLFVIWQLFKVRKAKREGIHSSLSRDNVKRDPNKH